ncbi:MAG TPA: DNA-directed RNA polymerase subunit delta [Candidatus Onthovivens sp.]|nr:DNA-directed RNA polymerase subunit delta [Candidatus Onthovivens sp.]
MAIDFKNVSMIEAGYVILSEQENPIAFGDLYKIVCDKQEIDNELREQYISDFYTDLCLDGRFVTLGNNDWDLRTRHKFEQVHIDMNDVYNDIETNDIDVEEELDEEEKALLGIGGDDEEPEEYPNGSKDY